MPPQRPPHRNTKRKTQPTHRPVWPRLLAGALALITFAALWFIDTGALLRLARFEAVRHPALVLGLLAAFVLLIGMAVWAGRPRPKPQRRRRARDLPSPSK